MKIPAFALFERSLRLETRSLATCWGRAGLLVVMLFSLFTVQTQANFGMYGAPGLNFLEWMVWINLIFISLAGVSYFASAITEEKEEMTLGLLRMTDLNPVAILLGKSTSRLIGAFLLLLAQLPFVLLAVTLGGVGLLQVLAAYATLVAYLFFLCNLALFFSVVFRNTGTAGGVTLFILIFFFFAHFWAAEIEREIGVYSNINLQHGIWPLVTDIISAWRRATPSDRLYSIFLTGFAGPIAEFQVVSNVVAGVVMFLLSWAVFDVCTRTEKDSGPARRWFFSRTTRRSSSVPGYVVGFSAITWKDFTFITGGRKGLLIKFAVLAVMVALCNVIALESNSNITIELEGDVLIWASLVLAAVWLLVEASRVFKDEVRWKTLSALLTLPISVRELAYRKALGALIGTLPLLAGTAVGAILVPDKVSTFFRDILSEPRAIVGVMVFILQYVLLLHLTAFLSLVVKRGALPLAIVIEYGGGLFFMMFTGLFFAMASAGPYAISIVMSFICVALTIPLHFGIWYRLELAGAQE